MSIRFNCLEPCLRKAQNERNMQNEISLHTHTSSNVGSVLIICVLRALLQEISRATVFNLSRRRNKREIKKFGKKNNNFTHSFENMI